MISLIRFGVVPKKMSSLWPEASSNFGLISAQTATIAPPARTLISAAFAFGTKRATGTDASNATNKKNLATMGLPMAGRV
jgi:hypothetical protein